MRPRLVRPLLTALAACLAAAGAAASEDLDLREVCDPYTPLTLIGMDSTESTALFSMPSRHEDIAGWLVELRAGSGEARLYPDWRRVRRFGGSAGPGPVAAVTRCGAECLQPVAWSEGRWLELGGPLAAPPTATVHTARDGQGTAWVVLHEPTATAGVVTARALRLEGERWADRGSVPVAAVGSPAVRPDPDGEAAVVSGSGRFGARSAAAPWVEGLPGLTAEQRGQLVPVRGRDVAYLARDGGLYLSADDGAGWWRATWAPTLEPPGTVGGWTADLPVGAAAGALSVAWFGRGDPDPRMLALSERPPGGPWRQLATLPAVTDLGGVEVGYSHVLRLDDGRWVLVAGCEVTPRGAALRVRTVSAEGAAQAGALLLRPTWLESR